MRQTSRLRVLEGLGMVVLRPCLRPVRVNGVKRAGLAGVARTWRWNLALWRRWISEYFSSPVAPFVLDTAEC